MLSIGLISATAAMRSRRARPTLIQRVSNDVAGFGNTVLSVPANGVGGFFSSVRDLLNTYQENNYLKSRVHRLNSTEVQNQALKSENQQLKKQLKLNATLTDYNKINATVLNRTPSNWQQQLIINKGSLAGVKKNMSVVVDQGLVGRISEVNATNSKVELITDSGDDASRFAVQVAGEKQTINGLISGYNNANSELEMGNLTANDKIKKGTPVMTSGLGGITPKGLYVGKVTSVSGTAGGTASQINIKPAADTKTITAVTVIEKK
ncbi:hypothetical protein FC87_GL000046 [Fructilactobacillus florum DSM 22689 = JCM 16035]|uniref:Cell shape-determining protein MreC n=1 Tax=Fructilactobacillus florum DSM 22689 = JCM 16035 TaxID=1423745 RepID=A0A0R2CMZ7_9LACO|nr:hypothetical protein FC87_GL000046 [Fructilactobacillus florum DSM 22689 = JCM 16035]